MFTAGLANASLLCAPAIATQLGTQLHFGSRQVGLFFSMEFGGYFVAGLIGRRLLPRFDWHFLAFAALAGLLAGTVATAYTLQIFALLLIVRLLTASCGALLAVISLASANHYPNASRAIGLYIVGQLLFGVMGLALLPALFARWGINAYLVCIAVISLFALAAIKYLSPDGARSESPSTGQRVIVSPWLKMRFPAIVLFYAALGGIWTFIADIAKMASLDLLQSGRILSAATVAGIFGASAASLCGDRLKYRRAVEIGYILLTMSGIALLFSSHLVAYLLAVLAFKFAWTFVIPYVFAIIGSYDGDGRLVSDISWLSGLGLMIGPAIAGYLVARGDGFAVMLIVDTALIALSGISVLCLTSLKGQRAIPADP